MEHLINRTIRFVQEKLRGAEAGHDWFHIERVYKNALKINEQENGDVMVVSLAALLHDIADSKFHDGDEELGPRIAGEFLQGIGVGDVMITHVQQIIKNLSYKSSLGKIDFHSKELDIVQDADRLDAIGAIGIARAFTYGGYKNRVLYDPAIKPDLNMTKEAYKTAVNPTINHFYEKLLLLKDLMKTKTGTAMALQRHEFMQLYLDQFYSEI
ncbi:HD domain-containing protein [Pedobacter ginsengisoli]|uniref:HD domain-containing protein n=1 Tax=Pedobacter ginsengisoli TaxID=363852 RepID=UPI00254FBA90|nr:HD domain-containing protein [Pedobacter ginsengisoli]